MSLIMWANLPFAMIAALALEPWERAAPWLPLGVCMTKPALGGVAAALLVSAVLLLCYLDVLTPMPLGTKDAAATASPLPPAGEPPASAPASDMAARRRAASSCPA